ncbi:MAG TPA: aminotransferase class I/II-fold pyridoxal phosphate-dependent enzyme [Candidatus Avacidaminococcus intestinavium]|uniref:Aminotransferase class I/II-fold pyridoxal phosphate-dependent enzyme n=1 Tax=Candidatus Avacidaminococcus intestinavium TaxID=2840684 RepID=A0A9D1MRE2_9FIRM|nr:aminotransferase class I/II-fold pyridoxal phosphate-dependent enzyme [Candidatus Avacidaminococcus intestinavium]
MYKYAHGGDIHSLPIQEKQKIVDFSANINPFGIPSSVKKAVKESLQECINYPDAFCRDLTKLTAQKNGVKSENIFFGNGAADVLFRLTIALRPKKALLLAPTFSDYEKALKSVDCNISYYNLREEDDFLIQEDFLEALDAEYDIVVICNPNNPTGQLVGKETIKKIANKCTENGIRLLIDECFMDFVIQEDEFSAIDFLANEHIILKAFTKIYAIPGLRLGYCITKDLALITKMRQTGQDWNVSVPAQAAGIAACGEDAYVVKTVAYIARERAYLAEALTELKIRPIPSTTNFLLFHSPVTDLAKKLRKYGFLIRDCSNYHNLRKDYYRIAVKKHSDNKLLINALRKICSDENIISDY